MNAESRQELKALVGDSVSAKPFNELYGVSFDHRGSAFVGDALLDALDESGYALGSFNAVGALTAASVPLVCAVMEAAARREAELDGFVMDFVYPSIKGPSIRGKRVVLIDAWLSEKSYVQTSSLVTLRNGNELSLDFTVVEHEGAQVVAIASLVGGLGEVPNAVEVKDVACGASQSISVVSPVDDSRVEVPFVSVFKESEFNTTADAVHDESRTRANMTAGSAD
jgi:orotate phosphoribosyltransferase